MTLKELARNYRDDIMEGIAWVAIWKVGKAWNAWDFHLDVDDKLDADDLAKAKAILAEDENAIMINEYYCAHMGDGTQADVAAGVSFHYESGYNLLKDWIRPEYGLTVEQQSDLDHELADQPQAAIDFLGTPVREAMEKTVHSLEKALEHHNEKEVGIQMAKWEVFKLIVKQLTGMEFFFTRTDEYYGLCTEDEKICIMKVSRKDGRRYDA